MKNGAEFKEVGLMIFACEAETPTSSSELFKETVHNQAAAVMKSQEAHELCRVQR